MRRIPIPCRKIIGYSSRSCGRKPARRLSCPHRLSFERGEFSPMAHDSSEHPAMSAQVSRQFAAILRRLRRGERWTSSRPSFWGKAATNSDGRVLGECSRGVAPVRVFGVRNPEIRAVVGTMHRTLCRTNDGLDRRCQDVSVFLKNSLRHSARPARSSRSTAVIWSTHARALWPVAQP
jgi:hypothetical protein